MEAEPADGDGGFANPSTRSSVAGLPDGWSQFDTILLARKYRFTVTEVRVHLEGFMRLDSTGRGRLTYEEFLEGIRSRFVIAEPGEILERLMHEACLSAGAKWPSEDLSFEQYLAWTQATAFSLDMPTADPVAKRLRVLAQQHGLPVPQVEVIWREYERCHDNCGYIDKAGFSRALGALLRVRDASDLPRVRIDRFWMDADRDVDGRINFEEFLTWYVMYCLPSHGHSRHDWDPASGIYAKLGSERLASYLGSMPES